MKQLGLALLIFGIGLSATFGSRNPDSIHQSNIYAGQVSFHQSAADEAFAAYCELLAAAEIATDEPCGPDDPADAEDSGETGGESDDGSAAQLSEPTTYEAAYEAAVAEHEAIASAGPEGLPSEVAAARELWLSARAETLEPRARALTEDVDSPGERLSSWFAISGIPFVLGLFLVVAGALVSRRAIAGSEPEGSGDSEGRPIDFGVMLGELVEELSTMASEVGDAVSPEALETTKTQIERLRRDRVERLVGARVAVERRHGLACYASIFGPFSRGERQLNRAWAAIVDNHGPEAAASIARASQAFAEALAEVPR